MKDLKLFKETIENLVNLELVSARKLLAFEGFEGSISGLPELSWLVLQKRIS